MSFIRYKQRGQRYYVYQVSNIWNKELKKYKQHSIYLGVASEKGGDYCKIQIKHCDIKHEKSIVDYGDSFIAHQILESCGLKNILKDTLPEYESVIALVLYKLICGNAMYNYQNWADGNFIQYLIPNLNLTSQKISNLLKILGKYEIQLRFFKKYIGTFFQDKHGVLIDSTALPSAINSSLNSWGYVNGGIDKKVGCLMLVDKHSKLPIFFRTVPGEIADVSTLQATLKEIELLGLKIENAIFDAGYFCETNISYLCEKQISFVSRMPKSHKPFKELFDKHKTNLEDITNAVRYGNRIVFIKSISVSLYGHQMFAHIILDLDKKAKDAKYLTLDFLNNSSEEIDVRNKLKRAGIFVLISRYNMEKSEILPSYYARQSIEQIFGFAKSNNDLLPIRVHSEESIRGYLFVNFIVLILFIKMRQKLENKFTVEQALIILRNIKAKIFDSHTILTELSKKQKNIFSLLNCTVPI